MSLLNAAFFVSMPCLRSERSSCLSTSKRFASLSYLDRSRSMMLHVPFESFEWRTCPSFGEVWTIFAERWCDSTRRKRHICSTCDPVEMWM